MWDGRDGLGEGDGGRERGRVAPMKKLLWKDKQAEAVVGVHIGKSPSHTFYTSKDHSTTSHKEWI